MNQRIIVREPIDHTLPILRAMGWETFQLFCTDLLFTDPRFSDARDFLKPGNKQDGIDVYAVPIEKGKLTVAQCKLYQYIAPSKLSEIVDTFLKGKFASETNEFILCTNFDFRTQKAEQAIDIERRKLRDKGITFTVYDIHRLETELRNRPQPELVRRYFGIEVATAFYGEELVNNWVKQYRKVQKRSYPEQTDYIERTLTSQKEHEEVELFFDGSITRPKLSGLFTLNSEKAGRKVALISVAGFGKTCELQQLVARFSEEKELFFPILNYLRDYEGQSIEELLRLHEVDWDYVPKEALLLVFDGLDEVNNAQSQTFINHLNQFAEANPKVHILVSSRANFYDLSNPPLRNFEAYFLNDFTQQDVADYISQMLPGQSDAFYQKVQQVGLAEEAKHPYYLSRLVRFYKDTSAAFPNNKSELFNRILFDRFERDKQKYGVEFRKADFMHCAEKLAFCLTLTGKSNLDEEALESLIPEEDLRKNFKRFFLLTPDNAAVTNLSFEHKNLQEFLCASVLQNIPFDSLKGLLTFEHAPEVLQPRFLNTVSFLFGTANTVLFEQLLDWLQVSQPDVLIRFEKDRIPKEVRLEIVKRILTHYGNKDLPLHVSQHFSFGDLAAFADLDTPLINYFEKVLYDEDITDWFAYDIIHLLSEYQRAFVFKSRLTSILLNVLQKRGAFGRLAAGCIDTLSKLAFFSKDILDAIFSSGIDVQDFNVRSSLVRYIEGAGLAEEFSDFLLESIPVYEEGQKETTHYGVNERLEMMIAGFREVKNIKATLQELISKPDLITDHFQRAIHFDVERVGEILKNAQAACKTDATVCEYVYQIFISNSHLSYDEKYIPTFKAFLATAFGEFAMFKRLYEEKNHELDLMVFVNQEGCDFLLDEFRTGNLTDEQMKIFRNRLSWADRVLFRQVQDTLLAEFGEVFQIDETEYNRDEIWRENEARNQQMLLDRNLFFEEGQRYAVAIGKDCFRNDDLWSHTNIKLVFFERSLVADYVRRHTSYQRRNGFEIENTMEEVLAPLREDSVWEWFKIKRVKTLLAQRKEGETIEPQLISFAEDWCAKKMKELDYENAVQQTQQDSWTIDSLVHFNNEPYRLLRMDVEDELLFKVLLSDTTGGMNKGELGLSGIIANQVKDKVLFKTNVIKNLKKDLPLMVLRSHLAICYYMQYQECFEVLYETIVGNKLTSVYDKSLLLDYYLELGGKLDDFQSFLPVTAPEEKYYNSWEWHLLNKLKDNQPIAVQTCLLNVLSSSTQPEENRIQACQLLIQMNQIEGLQYWKDYIFTHSRLFFDNHQELASNHVLNMPADQVIDIVADVLGFTYRNNLHETQRFPYSIENAAHVLLRIVGAASLQSFEWTMRALGKLIDEFSDNAIMRSIEFYRERIAQEFYKQHNKQYTLEEALSCYEHIDVNTKFN